MVLLYFVLNFAGFFVFLAIWNILPKPKPFDYTTIPGLKLNVETAEQIPDLVKKPGVECDKSFDGHLEEISKFRTIQSFIHFLVLTYGNLNSFWWFDRYVVTVSDESFLSEIKKFQASLIAISPFAIGSYLQADDTYCTTVEFETLKMERGGKKVKMDEELNKKAQERKFFNRIQKVDFVENSISKERVIQNLRQVENMYSNSEKSLRSKLSRPLLVVFDEEIWVDAHPIPKYIPIIINTEAIIKNWLDDELFPKFYASFYWLPGFHDLHDHL